MCINRDIINEEIKVKEVRLASDTESIVIDTKKALEMAAEQELDLVMISPTAVPPVCRIMDYSKFLFEKAKKEKERKKNQKVVGLKEVRLSPSIDLHDIEIKAKNAIKFLNNGDKVKLSIRFRGRQNNYIDAGAKVLDNFVLKLEDAGIVEKSAKMEGKNMFMIISPKN